jgi:serine/threonine protein kinase
MEQFTLKYRNKNKNQIVQHLKSFLSFDFGSACITNSGTLLKKLQHSTEDQMLPLIGQGAFGATYKINLKHGDLVVKEGRLTEEEYNFAKNKIYPKEYLINKVINNILKLNLNPNFLFTYAILFCNKCTIGNATYKCSETLMEYMDNDFLSFTDYFVENNTINTERSNLMMLSACFQILSAIDVLHRNYGIFHNDIKADNILVKIIYLDDDNSPQYSKYIVEGGVFIPDYTYYVPLIEIIPILCDFGVSKILKPNKTFETRLKTKETNPYGTRVKVINKHKIKKIDISDCTRQDLKNINLYPPLEFMEDIQNIIQTFTGGKGFRRGFQHPYLGNNKIKSILQPFINNDKSKAKPNHILANILMYDIFFSLFNKPKSSFSIFDTFSPYEEEILSEFNDLKI